MSAFKDQVDSDVSLVFLNCDEFADTHNLNGVECVCIIESPTTQQKLLSSAEYSGYEGIHGEILTIHVAKSKLDEVPIEGQVFKVDDTIYTVQSCIDEMGMLTIVLGGSMGG